MLIFNLLFYEKVFRFKVWQQDFLKLKIKIQNSRKRNLTYVIKSFILTKHDKVTVGLCLCKIKYALKFPRSRGVSGALYLQSALARVISGFG